MIYQDTKRFLKRYLQKPKKDYEWSGHDNFLLLNFIQSRYSDAEIENNLSEIKQAFRDFFEPVGNIMIRFTPSKGIAYKILPYYVEPKNSKHLKSIINIIQNNRRSIEYPYNGREDQIAILGKIRRHINVEIIETDEAVNKKELVRYAIKQALELDDRDVVLHLQRKYIIKLFKKNTLLNPEANEPKQKDKEELRFQGYNADDLSAHYDELINDLDIESFLDDTMALLFADKLNFDEITNEYYEKNVLSLVKNTIAQELHQHVSKNEDYILGLAGYIFRLNFIEVHRRIAIEIFELFAKKSENAERFLSYYSGKTILHNGERYSIPEISTPDGKRWSIPAVTAIATMWLRARHESVVLEAKLKNISSEYISISSKYEDLSKKSQQYSDNLISYIEQLKEAEDAIADVTQKIKLDRGKNLSHQDELELSRLTYLDKQKVATIKEKKSKLQPLKDEAITKLNAIKSKYFELKSSKQQMEYDIKALKKNLDINTESFHAILFSLVKALTQRKKLLVD